MKTPILQSRFRFPARALAAGAVLLAAAPHAAIPAPAGSAAAWTDYTLNPNDHSHLPNNSFAGYRRGETPPPDVPAVVNVLDCGAVADGVTDNTLAFRQAIEAAWELGGGAVIIPPGTYSFRNIILLRRSGVVLRGAGIGQTILKFERNLTDIFGANLLGSSSKWNWSGGLITVSPDVNYTTLSSLLYQYAAKSPSGYSNGGPGQAWEYFFHGADLAGVVGAYPRGGYTVQVNDASVLREGGMYLMTWDITDDNSLLKEIGQHPLMQTADYGTWITDEATYPRWQWPVQVARIDGNLVTLAQPLRVAVQPQWNVRFREIGPHVRESGVESLTILMDARASMGVNACLGWNAMYFNKAYDCWAWQVQALNGENGFHVSGSKAVSLVDTLVEGDRGAHHMYTNRCESADILYDGFVVNLTGSKTPGTHGINTEWLSSGNVWTRGWMNQGTFDTHRALSFDYIRTDITVANNKESNPGGASQAGPYTGRRTAHWNVIIDGSDRPLADLDGNGTPETDSRGLYVYQPDNHTFGALVGIRGAPWTPEGSWAMPHGDKDVWLLDDGMVPSPANLYDAQMEWRAASHGWVQLVWPNTDITEPGAVWLEAAVALPDGRTLQELRFLANGALACTAGPGSTGGWWTAAPGLYEMQVEAVDDLGTVYPSSRTRLTAGWRILVEEDHPAVAFSSGQRVFRSHFSGGYAREGVQNATLAFKGTRARFFTGSTNGSQRTDIFLNDMVTPLAELPYVSDGVYDQLRWDSGDLADATHVLKIAKSSTGSEQLIFDRVLIDCTDPAFARPPVACLRASATAGKAPLTIELDGSPSWARQGALAAWQWDFDHDGTVDATGATTSVTFNQEGAYTILMRVVDSNGVGANRALQIAVSAPQAVAAFTPSATAGTAPLTVTFDAAQSMPAFPGGAITLYEWDFEDDGTWDDSGPVVQHTYTLGGDFTARLRVTDGDGYQATATALISISGNNAPVVSAGADISGSAAAFPRSLFLAGTATDDGLPGPPLTLRWQQISGPAPALLVAPLSLQCEAELPVPGTYVFKLSASDSQATGQDSVTVTLTQDGQAGVFQESGGLIVIEGEHFDNTSTRSDPGASYWASAASVAGHIGSGYVQIFGSSGTNGDWSTASEVTYRFTAGTPATYSVWVRRRAINTGANSVYWGIDGAVQSGVDNNNTLVGDVWLWVRLGSVALSAGEHTLSFRRRENNYQIDRIMLTTSGDPSADGPPESSSLAEPSAPVASLATQLDGSVLRVEWDSEAGVRYRLQRSTDLVNWVEAEPDYRTGNGSRLSFEAPFTPAGGPVFFRCFSGR